MSQQSIGANPTGLIGKLAGWIMNLIHANQYQQIVLEIMKSEENAKVNILDIGCGGGIAIKHFSKHIKEGCVYGIDISPEMVKLAQSVNEQAITEGRVSIALGNVENMKIPSNSIGIVTIFDNINFWNNYTTAFSEIRRILTDAGRVFIVNEYPEEGTKWYEFVKFKGINDYRKLLESNGFSLKKHELVGHTIVIEGLKSE